jgi:phage gp29-like protein
MSKRNRQIQKAKNFGFNTTTLGKSSNFGFDTNPSKEAAAKDLHRVISPVQLQRLRTDVSMWRDAISEAEKAWYPFRVKMQRIFIDTILNGHVFSLMERRKDLTLLRKYAIMDADGNENEELTQYFQNSTWFGDFLGYTLDARFFGYSLISLGDIINDQINEVSLIPRWFISPDRHEVGSFIYATSGADFREPPQSDWHVYVKTKSDNGTSPCGYGLLYQIALYEIFLRNTLGFNGDFVELFAMPYRVGKTTKTTEAERSELESAIRNMGSAGYAIVDPMDEIEFLEGKTTGTGYKSYESLEKRCEDKVSKIILGHADAVDSTPGKLGGTQGEESPVAQALEDKQIQDARFVEPVINNQLIPKLRNLGLVNIPEGYTFKFINDGEEEETRVREDNSNLITAQIAQTMKSAGLQMDAGYFQERTGIVSQKIELPAPVLPGGGKSNDARDDKKVKNRLKELYK